MSRTADIKCLCFGCFETGSESLLGMWYYVNTRQFLFNGYVSKERICYCIYLRSRISLGRYSSRISC